MFTCSQMEMLVVTAEKASFVNANSPISYPGLAYQITESNDCELDVGDKALPPLTDNNFGTCAAMFVAGTYTRTFGLFMDFYGVQPLVVGVIVVGNGFSCVPSDGVKVQIIYSNGQNMDCQASAHGKVCHFSCLCDHRCMLALVTIPEQNARFHPHICELTTGKLHVN